ncbi:signal transduction histidine kinase [Agromyces flavus]|uniref:histidine kinase n=1 Tax=Agromyces flavus TaxID=589382 RepID=A0A1H1NJI0_9MICO|nr:histidine kinase [Agromyces flavus]MCP2369082.1 signal transduction histidine kinase [Agromyces flavus]GGI48560.1 hypothetical protein GCM10010932_32480 [Agromyces flavus]SDR99142.1 Histidine kinase-, DNA gyrase B-, and HSP90-like ATPase [Agromyces flavus]
MGPSRGIQTARVRIPWTTVAVALIGAATIACSVLLLAFARPMLTEPWHVAAAVAIGGADIVLGAIVARAVPGDVTAPLLAALGLVVVLSNSVDEDLHGAWIGGWMLLYLPLALVLVVVPTGRPASRRSGAIALALCAVVASFMIAGAVEWLWPATSGFILPFAYVLLAAFFALLFASAAAPFARYRHAQEAERVQLRWVLLAGLSLPLTLLLNWMSFLGLGPDLAGLGLVVMLLAIPAGVTIALSRPELFDVDRAVAAAVAALTLLGGGLAVLSIASAVAGAPLANWPPLSAAVTTAMVTLIAAAAFPIVHRGFDRIFSPERARAVSALRRLSARVDSGAEPPEDVQAILRGALNDPGLVVGYRRPGEGDLVGLDGGAVATGATAAPIRVRGEEIGAIVPSASRTRRPRPAIARAAAPLVDAVRVRSELAHAAAEVEASRGRLLRAGYEERRRLERDLHDGAQQRLIALGMQLRLLQRTSALDADADAAIDAAVTQLGTAVAELRQLAHGVRPSALDDGLGPALTALAQVAPDSIELDVRVGDLPDPVATTAYFVVSEAVANSLRHAEASWIRVVARERDDVLVVRVSDDGRGGAAPRATGGLTGLSDRVAALGGRVCISSPAGGGTTVEANLPCGS